MWKNMYDFDLNLILGIVSGLLSGFAVSYSFLIESQYRTNFEFVRKVFDPIYSISACYMCYLHFSATNEENTNTKEKNTNASSNTTKTFEIIDELNYQWNQLTLYFVNFEPYQYSLNLKDILIEINDIISDGKYISRNTTKDYNEIFERFQTCIAQFEICQKNYKKDVLKLIYTSKPIRIFCYICVFMIVILFISA